MFKKNTAVTGFGIGHFINTSTGAAVTTGTPACKRTLDGTGGACANAAAYNTDGAVWEIDLVAGDMNGDAIILSFTLTDCLPISYTIRTVTKLVSDLADIAAADIWSVATRQLTGTQTFNLTGSITGNLSGSVGSVTGAVGSVTGAVGSVTGAVASVTGAVGSVTGNVGGNVVGSVASVTGNVSGNVAGSVASVTGAVGSVTGNVGGNVTGSVGSLATQAKADVNAETSSALDSHDLITHVWHVAKTGNDSNGGHHFTDAKLTITAAVTAAASGDTILIWPGDYVEAVNASAKSLQIIGQDRGTTRLIPASGTPLTMGNKSVAANLSLIGPSTYGLLIASVSDITVRNCYASGTADGVYVVGCVNLCLIDCHFTSPWDGANFAGETTMNILAENVTFETTGNTNPAHGCQLPGSGIYRNCKFIANSSTTSANVLVAAEIGSGGYAVKCIFDNCTFNAVATAGRTGIVAGLRINYATAVAHLVGCVAYAEGAGASGGPQGLLNTTGTIMSSGCQFNTSSGTITQVSTNWAAAVNAEVDTALSDYNPPTRTEATADKDAIIAEVNANETKIDTMGGVADAVKAVTDKLNTAMEVDGAVYRYTTNALEQAPGGGAGVNVTQIMGTALTETNAGDVADNISQFFNVEPTTTKTVNNVGAVASGGVPRIQ